jgi:hypothetical protein
MIKKLAKAAVARLMVFSLVCLGIIFVVATKNAEAGIDCEGSLRAYALDPNMKNYNCTCTSANSMPVCTKASSGGYSATPKKHNINQDIKMMIVEEVMGAMLQDIFGNPAESNSEQVRQQQEEQQDMARIAAERERQKALQKWQRSLAEAEEQRKLDQQDKVNQGASLMAKMQTIGSGNKIEPFRTGKAKLDLQPFSQNTYPSGQYDSFERLMCSAYFSNLAKKTVDPEDTRFYADQAARVMGGEPTYLECRIPPAGSEVMAQRMAAIKKTYAAMNEIDLRIKDIEVKLTETREKITAAETRKEEAESTISALKTRATEAPPEEKIAVDELLIQAQLLAAEIDQDILAEKQAESDLQKDKEQAENEFNTMKTELTAKQ